MKSIQRRSFFWSVFSCIWTEYRKIRTRKNSVFWHISPSATHLSLPPISNDDLRADISSRGSWQRMSRAFVDVEIFYPCAPSYWTQSLPSMTKFMESKKKRKYNQRVLDGEHNTLTPLVFTTNGAINLRNERILSVIE